MRTDGQPKGQPGPGRGRHRVSLTGPGTPSTLGQRSPTEGDRELWRPLETQPPQQQPPRDTGQKEPGPEPCPGPRVPREGRPLRTTTTHHPGHTQDRPGKDLVVPPPGDSGQRLHLQRVLPASSPDSPAAPALGPLPPTPGTLPVASPPFSSSGHAYLPRDTCPQTAHPRWHQSLRAAETGPPQGGPGGVSELRVRSLSSTESRAPDGRGLGSLQDSRGGSSAGGKPEHRSINSHPAALGSAPSCLNDHFTSLLRS